MQNWIIVLLRNVILFFLTLGIMRIIGRGNISKVTPFKFVSYIVIGIMVSLISLRLITNFAFAFVALGVWVLFSLVLDYLSVKSKWVHDFVNGRETVLIKDGKVMEENLMEARYTGEELLRELRAKNAFNLADVEFAVMETTGDINVLLKSDKKPITPKDLGKQVAPCSQPETVILDGNILDESLLNRGLSRQWLKAELSNAGVSLDNVFIAQVDSSGDLFIDIFDDAIQVTQPKVKEMLYANISKAQADILSFSLETGDLETRKMYLNNANKLKKVMDDLEPYLLH
ncbi:DUF421 domain-containing protein [Clostridium lundense]|uniref:DUF421 domain-containing protein n=1 Tax=Clostridium lundense TaxID=319475 RepID=UPI0004876469|nr:DUF421 domain-containing protein [Clostridium lundense]